MSNNPQQVLPKTAFGELSVAENTPIIQAAAQYNLGAKTRVLYSGTGATAGANNNSMFYCTSGTSPTGFSSVFSKRAGVYKSGQGLTGEFTALFDTAVADHVQRAGLISATDGYCFGYNGTDFGIFYSHHGQQEIQSLQVTTAASSGGGEVADITIDGSVYNATLTATTKQQNAKEIADALNAEAALALWEFQQVDDTVVSRAILSATVSGSFAFSSATSVGAWTQIAIGAEVTQSFIDQADWNGDDVSSWVNISGDAVPFNPEKGNVYKIQTQYLGFGNIFFSIECPCTGDFVTVHTLEYANENIIPTVSNPSFRIGWISSNIGATTSRTLQGATYALFIEGKRVFTEHAHSEFKELIGAGSTATNIITIKSAEVFGAKVNLSGLIPKRLSVTSDSTKGAIVQVNLNATVAGNQNWQYHSKEESTVIYDTEGTTVTNGAAIITEAFSGSFSIDLTPFNLELVPGQSLTVAITKLGSSTHDATAALVWQEDI